MYEYHFTVTMYAQVVSLKRLLPDLLARFLRRKFEKPMDYFLLSTALFVEAVLFFNEDIFSSVVD